MNAVVRWRTEFIFVFSTKVLRWEGRRVCEYMNSETSILDTRELPAFRDDGLCVGIFEKHYESENRISIVQNMNNSNAFIEHSVCSQHCK
jgi:hypothetical protein